MRHEGGALQGLDVEVNVDGAWTRGRVHSHRSSEGSRETLVCYEGSSAEADACAQRWFTHGSIRAVHVAD